MTSHEKLVTILGIPDCINFPTDSCYLTLWVLLAMLLLTVCVVVSILQNVVVATQPTATPPVTVVEPHLKPKPMVMIVTIVLTAVCLVQGCWPALVCLTPALIAAVVVNFYFICSLPTMLWL